MLRHDKIRQELVKRNCDWVDFKTNFPESSHMGGAWESQIRTVQNVLASPLTQQATQLMMKPSAPSWWRPKLL